MKPHTLTIRTTEDEQTLRLAYSYTDKPATLPQLKKAAREALEGALQALENGKVNRGSFSQGARQRWDELLIEEEGGGDVKGPKQQTQEGNTNTSWKEAQA